MSKQLKNVCEYSDFQQEIQRSNIRMNNIITVCMKTYWSPYNEVFKSAPLESDHRDILNTHGERIQCKGNHVFCQVFLCMNGLPGHHRLQTKYRRAVFRGREVRSQRYFLFIPSNMWVSPIFFLFHRLVHLKSNSTRIYCNIIVSWFLGMVYYCVFTAPRSELAASEGWRLQRLLSVLVAELFSCASDILENMPPFPAPLQLFSSGGAWTCWLVAACVCLIGAEGWLTHWEGKAWAPCCAWDHEYDQEQSLSKHKMSIFWQCYFNI